jgi:hypothetical protein
MRNIRWYIRIQTKEKSLCTFLLDKINAFIENDSTTYDNER